MIDKKNLAPKVPNSEEESELEQRVFNFLHNQEDVRVPPEAEQIINELWEELVKREVWYFKCEGCLDL